MTNAEETARTTDVEPPLGIRSSRARQPRTVALSHAQCMKLLARNQVGRLAYTFRDAVDIVPLHYAHDDEWIYIRTSGQKLAKLRHHRWVAFEVDEIFGMFDWSSVVAYGTFYELAPDAEQHARAVNALREAMPDAFTARTSSENGVTRPAGWRCSRRDITIEVRVRAMPLLPRRRSTVASTSGIPPATTWTIASASPATVQTPTTSGICSMSSSTASGRPA